MEYPPQEGLKGCETLSLNQISLDASPDDDSLHSNRSESKLSSVEHAEPEDHHGSRKSYGPASEASDRPGSGVEEGEQGEEHVHGWSLFALLVGICLAVFIISVDRTIITTVNDPEPIFTLVLTHNRPSHSSQRSSSQQRTSAGTAQRTSSRPPPSNRSMAECTFYFPRNGHTSSPSASSRLDHLYVALHGARSLSSSGELSRG